MAGALAALGFAAAGGGAPMPPGRGGGAHLLFVHSNCMQVD